MSSSMNLDDKIFLKALGDRLRELRATQQLTQAELADRCHLHRTFIGSVERGERNLSILNLRLIAKVLRVPLSDLLADLPGRKAWGLELITLVAQMPLEPIPSITRPAGWLAVS